MAFLHAIVASLAIPFRTRIENKSGCTHIEWFTFRIVFQMDFALLVRVSVVESPQAPKCIILDKRITKIGRASEVKMDTSIGREVSKLHASIIHKRHHENFKWIIEDQHSLNATFVNRKKIKRCTLRNNDIVIFGAGSSYRYGDLVIKTDYLECVYKFVIPDPPIILSPINSHSSEDESSEECSICFEAMHRKEQLTCGHCFCSRCLNHWARTCEFTMQPTVCPVCRAPFNRSDIRAEDPRIKDDSIFVNSIDPLLRALGLNSIDDIELIKGTNNWDETNSDIFWQCKDALVGHSILRRVFTHVLNLTYRQVYEMNSTNLKQVIKNLKGNVNTPDAEIKAEAMGLIAIHMYNVNNTATNINTSSSYDEFFKKGMKERNSMISA